jgi:hypothetical protein
MPTAKSIVTAAALRNVSIYFSSPEFVADQVFPIMNINDPTAKITKYLESDFFRNDAGPRGEGSQARRGSFKTTEVTYNCIEYAFASPVTDELRRNSAKLSAQPLLPDQDAVELCKRKVMMNREGKLFSLVTGSTWADGTSGGTDMAGGWNASASVNTFISSIDTAKLTLASRGIVGGGDMEIRLIMDDLTFAQIKEISRVRDQFKYTSAESITPDMIARMLDIDKVIVTKAVHNTAKETKAGTEFTSVRFFDSAGTSAHGVAFLYAYPKSIKPRMLCAGLMTRDKFDASEGGGFERVMKWREAGNHQDVYEVAENRDEIQIAATAGYLFKDTITT